MTDQTNPDTRNEAAEDAAASDVAQESGNAKDSGDPLDEIVHINEVVALIGFLSERGVGKTNPDGAKWDKDTAAKVEQIVTPLCKAVTDLPACTDRKAKAEKTLEIVEGYRNLTAITYPALGVNGRTVLRSNGWVKGESLLDKVTYGTRSGKALTWLVVSFTLAVITEAMRIFYGPPQVADVPYGWVQEVLREFWVYDLYRLVLVYLQPFFWGAAGASVYIVKHTADLIAERKYDPLKMQGVSTRVVLGGVFGAVIVHLFFGLVTGTDFDIGGVGPSAVAFLSGLGIRAIYAAFEKVLDDVRHWIDGTGAAKSPQGGAGN